MITDGSFTVHRARWIQIVLLAFAAGTFCLIGSPVARAMQLPSHLPPPTDPNTASASPDSGNGSGSNSGGAGSGESSSVAPPSDSDSTPSTSGDADRKSPSKDTEPSSRAHNPEPPPGATPPPDADDDAGDNAASHGAGKSAPPAKSAPPLGPGESSSAAPDAIRDPEDSPNIPPSRAGKSPSKSAGDAPAGSAGKDAPDYAPLHAEESMEVGIFYMHKGDLSAAADRFKYAIELQPHLAKPHLLLAKIAEKKNDKAAAVRYYQEYLAILPNAPDAAKVRSRIAELKE